MSMREKMSARSALVSSENVSCYPTEASTQQLFQKVWQENDAGTDTACPPKLALEYEELKNWVKMIDVVRNIQKYNAVEKICSKGQTTKFWPIT